MLIATDFGTLWGVALAAFVGTASVLLVQELRARRARQQRQKESATEKALRKEQGEEEEAKTERQLIHDLAGRLELVMNGRKGTFWEPPVIGIVQLAAQIEDLHQCVEGRISQAASEVERVDQRIDNEVIPRLHDHREPT